MPQREKIWDRLIRSSASRPQLVDVSTVLHRAARAGDVDLVAYILLPKNKRMIPSEDVPRKVLCWILEAAVEAPVQPETIVTMVASWCRDAEWTLGQSIDVWPTGTILNLALRNPAAGLGLFEALAALPNIPTYPGTTFKELIGSALHGQFLYEAIARRPDYGVEIYKALDRERAPSSYSRSEEGLRRILRIAVVHGNAAFISAMFECLGWEKNGYPQEVFWDVVCQDLPDEKLHRAEDGPASADGAAFAASETRMFEAESPESTRDCSDALCHQHLLDLDIPGVFSRVDLEALIAKAASFRGPKVLQLLLGRARAAKHPVQRVSASMMQATVENRVYGHLLLPILDAISEDKSLFSQEELLRNAAAHTNVKSLMFLLGKSSEDD